MRTTHATAQERTAAQLHRLPLVGTDAEGATHRFDWNTDTVYVLQDGAIEHTEQLQPGELTRWIAYVRRERGWDDLRYDDRPLAEKVADVVEAGV